MIIDKTYFRSSIYLPEAKPGLGDEPANLKLQDVIDEYAYDCLLKSLGKKLSKEFISQLDPNEANGLLAGADAKWNDLLNGKEYTANDGTEKEWRGIRFKNSPLDTDYNVSLIAFYVYFFHEQINNETRSIIGNVSEDAKNATNSPFNNKAVRAWNKFVELTQGLPLKPTVIVPSVYESKVYGISYYNEGEDVNLYEFINDSNDLVADTYANFSPKYFKTMNTFNI